MTSTSTPLVYTYPVSSLGAGASFGNEDVFLRTSRESDWNGLWHARDDTFYLLLGGIRLGDNDHGAVGRKTIISLAGAKCKPRETSLRSI